MTTALLFVGGLALLIVGAEALVRGASRLAGALGIPPLIVGLTVVAFGTSSPELAVSAKAALDGQAGIAVGNVVGSNIFNVLFILGISALIVPLTVSRQLVRLDVPLMIAVSVLALLLALDGHIGRLDAALLLGGLAGYLLLLVRASRRAPAGELVADLQSTVPAGPAGITGHATNGVLVAGGLVLLVLGSRWLVDSAVTIAAHLGVSELVIGLTIIAAGTSMPEVVTSIVASLRGERDIAVGNVVGSNIFNILGVLGLAGVLAPAGMTVSPEALRFDFLIMIAVALACLPIFFTAHRIDRWEGLLFLAYYVAYVVFLVLGATGHAALPLFGSAMIGFVIPLTAVTLAVLAVGPP